jgi:cell division protein FtsN
MWYQATEQVTPVALHDTFVTAVEPPTRSQDLTFYSTLSPEPPARMPGTASTPPLLVSQHPRSVAPAPSPQVVSLPAAKGPERGVSQAYQPAPPSIAPALTAVPPQPSAPGYSVQVGSFRAREEAEQLRSRLTQKGYPVLVLPSVVAGQGIWYRVRVGHFPDRAAADRAAQRLATQERVSVLVTEEAAAR